MKNMVGDYALSQLYHRTPKNLSVGDKHLMLSMRYGCGADPKNQSLPFT